MSSPPLRVLTWPDYAIESVAKRYQETTGTPVRWFFFDQNEEAFQLLRSRPDAYDVIFADGAWPRQFHKEGLVRALTPTDFVTWSDINPFFRHTCPVLWRCQEPDGSRMCAFPYNWGLRGIVYDPAEVPSSPGWYELFHSLCPIWLNSQGSEIIVEAAIASGIDPADGYELTGDQLWTVGDLLLQAAPRVGGIWRLFPELLAAFERGAAVAEVHSTVLVSNIERALRRPMGVSVPSEGTVAYVDGAMISSACERLEEAALFIDLLCSPDGVVAAWEESDGYLSTNQVAHERLLGDARFHEKLKRAGDLSALEGAAMYRAPIETRAYGQVWSEFVRALTCPVPDSVRMLVESKIG